MQVNQQPVDPNTTVNTSTSQSQGGSSTTPATQETLAQLENSLKAMLGIVVGSKTGNVTDATGVDSSLPASKDLQVFNSDGSLKVTMGASDPKVQQANEELIEQFIGSLATGGPNISDAFNSLAVGLIANLSAAGGVNSTATTNDEVDSSQVLSATNLSTAGAEGGKGSANAFLGGLVMVTLAKVMAEFAKDQANIEKMGSVMFLSSQALQQDLAKSIAKATIDKADTQANAKIMEAVVTAVTTSIQMVATMGSLSKLSKQADIDPATGLQKMEQKATGRMTDEVDSVTGETKFTQKTDESGNALFKHKTDENGNLIYNRPKEGGGFEEVSGTDYNHEGLPIDSDGNVLADENGTFSITQTEDMVPNQVDEMVDVPVFREPNQIEMEQSRIYGQYGQMANQMGQATSNLIEAQSIRQAGQDDADITLLQFQQDQAGKMQDKWSQMGSDAAQKVNDAWDLLKNMFSSITQAFRSLTGK